jgi:hypothetical protein
MRKICKFSECFSALPPIIVTTIFFVVKFVFFVIYLIDVRSMFDAGMPYDSVACAAFIAI